MVGPGLQKINLLVWAGFLVSGWWFVASHLTALYYYIL